MERYLVRGVRKRLLGEEPKGLLCNEKEKEPKKLCGQDAASGKRACLSSQEESKADKVSPTNTSSEQKPHIAVGGSAAVKTQEESRMRSLSGSEELTVNTSAVTKIRKEGLELTYYPRFIPSREATVILNQLESELSPYFTSSRAVTTVKLRGKEHSIPRQQTAFGDDGLSYTFSGTTLPALPWSPTVMKLRQCVESVTKHSFNFALVNRYRNGLDHIGEHQDNEQELCSESPIVSLSFGQERDFVFRHKDSRGRTAKRKDIVPVKVCLAHGSMLVMAPPTNREWYHGLPVRRKALLPRINITFREMKTVN